MNKRPTQAPPDRLRRGDSSALYKNTSSKELVALPHRRRVIQTVSLDLIPRLRRQKQTV